MYQTNKYCFEIIEKKIHYIQTMKFMLKRIIQNRFSNGIQYIARQLIYGEPIGDAYKRKAAVYPYGS